MAELSTSKALGTIIKYTFLINACGMIIRIFGMPLVGYYYLTIFNFVILGLFLLMKKYQMQVEAVAGVHKLAKSIGTLNG